MSERKETDSSYNVVCPHCNKEQSDSWEIFQFDDTVYDFECGHCEKEFDAYRDVSISYRGVCE